jgi:type I restriction enzyme S subunit
MSFELTTLGEYARIQGGFAYKSKDFIENSACKVIKIKNIRFGIVDYSETAFIDKKLAKQTSDWSTNEGDILISMTGSGPSAPQSLVGRVARVWKNEPETWINQRVGRLIIRNKERIHPDFLFYLLSSSRSQEYLVSNSSGSANQANISGKVIESLPCPEVTYKQSVSISNLLKKLDEKIIINRQINQTLEEIAQAIFKSWFVNFEPVKAKIKAKQAGATPEQIERASMCAISGKSLEELEQLSPEKLQQLKTTADLFPDSLVDSELGEIPKGWSAKPLGNFIEIKRGGSPRPIKDYIVKMGFPWIKIADATKESSPFLFKTKECIKEEGLKKTVLLKKGTLILSNSATPGLPKFLALEGCIHDGWLHFPQKKLFSDLYLFQLFLEIKRDLISQGNGSVFTNLKTDILRNQVVVIPSTEIVNKFDEIVSQLFQKIKKNCEEINTLIEIRNTLLPKFLSGELSPSQAEELAESVG